MVVKRRSTVQKISSKPTVQSCWQRGKKTSHIKRNLELRALHVDAKLNTRDEHAHNGVEKSLDIFINLVHGNCPTP